MRQALNDDELDKLLIAHKFWIERMKAFARKKSNHKSVVSIDYSLLPLRHICG